MDIGNKVYIIIGIILSASDREGQAFVTCLPCQPNSVKLVFPLIQYIYFFMSLAYSTGTIHVATTNL